MTYQLLNAHTGTTHKRQSGTSTEKAVVGQYGMFLTGMLFPQTVMRANLVMGLTDVVGVLWMDETIDSVTY